MKVSGTIAGVPAITTHTEPADVAIAVTQQNGAQVEFQIGNYANTGNVPQTVSVTIGNTSNCSFVYAKFRKNSGGITNDSVVLQAGELATLFVKVSLSPLPVGTPDTPFTFDVTPSWS